MTFSFKVYYAIPGTYRTRLNRFKLIRAKNAKEALGKFEKQFPEYSAQYVE